MTKGKSFIKGLLDGSDQKNANAEKNHLSLPGVGEKKNSGNLLEMFQKKGEEAPKEGRGAMASPADRFVVVKKKGRFIVLLDRTGSMSSLIDAAKNGIVQIINAIKTEAVDFDVKLQFGAYGDYNDPADCGLPVYASSAMTNDENELFNFLGSVIANGGDDTEEALEVPLAKILKSQEEITAVLVIADAPGHGKDAMNAYGKSSEKTAIDLANEFANRKIPIHTLSMVNGGTVPIAGLKQVSDRSGGVASIFTNQMVKDIVGMMLASLSTVKFEERIKKVGYTPTPFEKKLLEYKKKQ